MGADIFEVAPPRWLQEIARPLDARQTGQTVGALAGGLITAAVQNKPIGEAIEDSFNELKDPLWQLHRTQAQVQLETHKIQLATAQQKLEATQHDQGVLPAWLQTNNTWDKRQNAEPPYLLTPEAQRAWYQITEADARSAQAKADALGKQAFAKRITELSTLDPKAGALWSPLLGQRPTPEQAANLETAMETAQLQNTITKNQARFAFEENAKKTGQQVTQTYSEKSGFSISSRPPKETEYPKIEVTEAGGKRWLQYGKIIIDLSKLSASDQHLVNTLQTQSERVRADIIVSKLKGSELARAQTYLADADARTRAALTKYQPGGATGTNSGGGINFDDFQQWKKSNR